jgi:serine protease
MMSYLLSDASVRPIGSRLHCVIPSSDTRRRLMRGVAGVGAALSLLGACAGTAGAAPAYVPGRIVVGYKAPSTDFTQRLGAAAPTVVTPRPRLLRLPRGTSVHAAILTLRRRPGIAYAVPDYIAHQAGSWIPNDPGRAKVPDGWEALQWNFLPTIGVNAPQAWANLIADHRAGASGVVIAVLDTGIAYRNWHQYRKSPDFTDTRFLDPYDFVAGNAYPLDREGHGTFVAGTIAESTNNGIGVTGLAYGATIMPVRVLDAQGNGDAVTIANGIRYAVTHGAKVINLSLEFGLNVTAGEIPEMTSALAYAHSRGVIVVGAAGNDSGASIAYPARDSFVISVGATTKDRCLANYSNTGGHLDIVAPGGGDDADLPGDPNCHPNARLPDIFQTTFYSPSNPAHFGLPGGWYGTSMSAPHVAAAAAMVIASGVIGARPTPENVLTRIEHTAQPLGSPVPNADYGYGLLNAGAATAPVTATTTPTTPTPPY